MKVWLCTLQRAPTATSSWISTKGPTRVSIPDLAAVEVREAVDDHAVAEAAVPDQAVRRVVAGGGRASASGGHVRSLDLLETGVVRVWIDLANSPHPRIFGAIAARLEAAGATAVVTVRDHAQTAQLARERWPDAPVVGPPSGRGGRAARVRETAARARELIGWARGARPDVALSHNSYGQLAAAWRLGIPIVTAMDFEYQPANHLAFRLADRVLLPAVVPERVVRRQGARPAKTIRYPGFKEELYLEAPPVGRSVLAGLGLQRDDGAFVAVARAEAAGAAYHPRENPVFFDCVRRLVEREGATCVVLVRKEWQRLAFEEASLPRCVIPDEVVDGNALLAETDLFLGGGGTMTREAALLGIPTYSVLAGRRPAVDRALEAEGRLRYISMASELEPAAVGRSTPRSSEELREHAEAIADVFVGAVFDLGERGSARR